MLKELGQFLDNKRYLYSLIITALFSYGYTIVNASISIDDLARGRYFSGELFAQGRFSSTIISNILGLEKWYPYFENLLSVFSLGVAVTLICILFNRASGYRMHTLALASFSCLFISYPLISEVFIYSGTNLSISLGMFFCTLSLHYVQQFWTENKILLFIYSLLSLSVAISFYEALVPVFMLGVLSLFVVRHIISEDKISFIEILHNGSKSVAVLIFAILAEHIVATIIKAALGLSSSNVAQAKIAYIATPIYSVLRNLMLDIFNDLFVASFYYLPIATFLLSLIAVVIWLFMYTIKRRDGILLLLFCLIFLSIFSLTIVQGTLSPYRVIWFSYSWLISLSCMLLLQFTLDKPNSTLKGLVTASMGLLIFLQANDLNRWFSLDILRYKQEEKVINLIGQELYAKYDVETLPVIFVGSHKQSDVIRKECTITSDDWQIKFLSAIFSKTGFNRAYNHLQDMTHGNEWRFVQTNLRSALNWSIRAFQEVNTETLNLFTYHGYDLKQGTKEMYDSALKHSNEMPEWPKNGSIIDVGTHIIVNL